MAIVQIDSFVFERNGTTYNVDVFADQDTGVVSATGFTSGLVTEQERGRPLNELFGGIVLTNGLTAEFRALFTYPYASSTLAETIPDQCDLALTVNATNETAQGANNGSVTLTASSSFANPVVSIDGVTYVPTPHTYTGLAPNNYTAYAKDDNNCTRSSAFTVDAFNNPIEGGFAGGLPQVQVSTGNISRWNAAYNPIILNFQNTPDPAKKNFRIEVEITTPYGSVTGTWSPSPQGKTRADISAYLQTFVNSRDGFDYDVINYIDVNRATSFTIRYREVWDDSASVWFSAPQPLYVTYSAKQLGDKYGGNMAEYVTFLNEPNPSYKAKFLTLFDEPTAWAELPFDTSWIRSEYLAGQQIKLRTISLDINRQPIAAGTINSFLLGSDSGYILGSDVSRIIIAEGALPPISNVDIEGSTGINRLMLAGAPGVNVEYFQIQLYTGPDETPNFITQALVMKINRTCKDPYVYLKWLNTLGGWDSWRFGYDQIVQLTTSDGTQIDRYVFDWENDETITDTIKKNAAVRISMGAAVPDIKVKGLTGLHQSTRIQMLFSDNPIKWHTVTLQTGSFDIKRTRSRGATLKFTINLPQINIQQNGSVPQ